MSSSPGPQAAAARLRGPLGSLSLRGVTPRSAIQVGLIPVVAAVAFVTGGLEARLAIAASLGLVLLLLSVRWPWVPLFAFVALIPIEEIIGPGEFGTVSRLAGVLFAVTYGIPRLGRIALPAMPVAAWAFVAWAVFSVTWALDQQALLLQLPTLIQLFVIAILVADLTIARPDLVRPLLQVYTVSAGLTALLAIEGFVSGRIQASNRVAAIEQQDVAQFAALLLPALLFALDEIRRGRHRLYNGSIAAVTAFAIVLSGTRGAWLSFAIVAPILLLPPLRPGQRAAVIGAGICALVLALQIPAVHDLVTERTDEALATGGAGRTEIWTVATDIFLAHPMEGVGWANFPLAFTGTQVLESGVAAHPGSGPHSLLYGTLGELGAVGLALLLLFLVPLVLRQGWGPDATIVRAGLASLLVSALFLDVLSNRKQVWLLIGLAAGLQYLAGRRGGGIGDIPGTNP